MKTTSSLHRIPEPDILSPHEDEAYMDIGFQFSDTIRIIQENGLIKTGDIVLDLGCAGGDLVEALSKEYPQNTILGIDPSETMISRAKRSYPRNADSFSTSYLQDFLTTESGKQINVMICESVLHHIYDVKKNLFAILSILQDTKPTFKYLIKDLKRPMNEKVLQNLLRQFPGGYSETVKKMYENSLRAAYTVDEVGEYMKATGCTGEVTQDAKYLYIISKV